MIATKIQVPRRPPRLLPRKRLLDFLHLHLDRRLILISAPAGYGKTSLLANLAHDSELPICWYTLDRFDGDFRVFLEYFIAAIARRFPAFGQRSRAFLREVKDPGAELYALVSTVVQEIYEAIPEYFCLILDDHHAVQDQEQVAEFLDLLLTYADENLHLILASRELPALPGLALLVARRQAAGLSIDELRFTPEEIQSLAQSSYGYALTEEQARSLAERTEGWITGLLLTAVPQWQRASQAAGQLPVRGKINVNLYDYFSQQVLVQQAPDLQDFLLASSVLDELSPAICADVLGIDSPATLLAQLRTRNVFVIEFEGEDERLRYHDLFRDFLQTTLRRRDEPRFREMVRRAADAYAARGEWARAVSRYLELDDYESVVGIIERSAMELFGLGRWDTLAGWIDALPEEVLIGHPSLLVHRGKIYSSRGDQTRAIAIYDAAELAFEDAGDTSRVALAVALKGYVLSFLGQYEEAITHCREALALVSGETTQQKLTMALAEKNIGASQLRLGRLAEGQEALRRALRLYDELGYLDDLGMVYHDLGLSYDLAGDLDAAVEHYEAALQRWRQLDILGPWADTLNGLGVVYHLQGRYEEAMQALGEALSKAQQIGYLRVEALTWASLGDLYRDLGRYRRAQDSYAEALDAAGRAHDGFVVTYALAGLGDVSRRQGDLARAAELLQEAMARAHDHKSTYEIGLCHVALGLLSVEEGDPATARHHLDQAVERFEQGGFRRDLVRACLYRGYATFRAGEKAGALADLERVLRLKDELGLDQALIVEGQHLQPLLRYAAEQGLDGETFPELLERIEEHLARVAAARREEQEAERAQDPEATAQVKIYGLGLLRVEQDGQAVQWRTLQSRDLLFCLLQHPQGLSKETVGDLFWPDHAPEKLHAIFHSTLYRLRRALACPCILFEAGMYSFDRGTEYWFDVEVFEDLLHQAETEGDPGQRMALLTEALALYRGDYLAGLYEDWPMLERERLRGRFLAALEELAELHADRGDFPEAVERYRRLLALAPYQESAHRGLMTCYYRQGDRAAAIRQYHHCVELLRDELGLSPMPETENLYLEIID
ncbi:MAG: BTAD domain-containing putative transcriptional regulator [Anaerolineae bacterium]